MSPSTKRKNNQNEKVVINTINPSHVTVHETRTQMHHHIQKSGKSVHVWGSTGPKCFANSYLPPPFFQDHLLYARVDMALLETIFPEQLTPTEILVDKIGQMD